MSIESQLVINEPHCFWCERPSGECQCPPEDDDDLAGNADDDEALPLPVINWADGEDAKDRTEQEVPGLRTPTVL